MFHWSSQKIQGTAINAYNLYSLSTDGKILVWQQNIQDRQNQYIQLDYPIKGYTLHLRKDGVFSQVGGLCFQQNIDEKNNYIVGSEAGSLLRAEIQYSIQDERNSIIMKKAGQCIWKDPALKFMMGVDHGNVQEIKTQIEAECIKKNVNRIELKNLFQAKPDIKKVYKCPLKNSYESHLGPIYSIDFNRQIQNLFLTSSLDGSVRLYDSMTKNSLFSVDIFSSYIYKAEFSPTRPSVFAAALSQGQLVFYDLLLSKQTPVVIIDTNDLQNNGQNTVNCLNLIFNQKQQDILAVAYSRGQIRILQLSDQLCKNEQDDINNFQEYINSLKTNN